MKIYGGIDLNGEGMHSSVMSMHLQQRIMGIVQDNITGFNKVGYQKKMPVISSFSEFVGAHALSENKDEEVGRIKLTKKPLDLALGNQGYFQVQTSNGTKLTRDGRFKLDKDGYLLTIQDFKVLSREGVPVKFDKVPKSLSEIKIENNGLIKHFDPESLKTYNVGVISTVSAEGAVLDNPNVKQGYIEQSNVTLQEEIYKSLLTRKTFSANRQLFIIQNESLSKMLQELGKA